MATKKERRFKRNLKALERNTKNMMTYYGISPLASIEAAEQLGCRVGTRGRGKAEKKVRVHRVESVFISR